MHIPKLIMQTWKTKDVPEKWKSSQEAIFRLMPEYEYVLMTDEDNENFVRNYFPQYLSLWNSFEHPIQKADAIRYMFLYKYGGYYVDLDIEPKKSFDELPQGDLLLMPSANNINCLTNSFMASVPKHSFWIELLNSLNRAPFWARGKHLKVMYTTGPKILDYVAKNSRYSYVALSPSLMGSACICNYNKDIPGTFFKTLEGGSWLSPEYMSVMKFFRCSEKAVLALMLLFLIILGLVVWFL